jgi:threonyl-tRNA synthetase
MIDKLRHTGAHILAQAVTELFPKVKLGIGPTIENGFYYDFDKKENFTQEDLKKIEKLMKEISKRSLKIEKVILSRLKAKNILKNQKYKLEILKDLKDKNITFYKQGEFVDLCKGPHLKSTKEVKYFKILNTAGAYWKGSEKNPMLQRIYVACFQTKQELKDYLTQLEEAKKRDHRKLGKELELFSIHEEAPGMPFFHDKGNFILSKLTEFITQEMRKLKYQINKTPILLNKSLWLKSGHWDHYKENMYFTKIDNKDYAIKPMNCPGNLLIFKSKLHSYKELPIKAGEFGLVHRHELSGVLTGLFRVRVFTQDDAHIFCTKEQLEEQIIELMSLMDKIYSTFGLTYEIELSTKPEKAMGDEKIWKLAEKILAKALKSKKIKYQLNKGSGAFYGPKIDFNIKDSMNRKWQCGTIQLDFSMPEKFDLNYEGKDGKKHRPIMLHRAIYGSLERFFGVLIEHYAGKFPLWLSPLQVKIVTVTDKHIKFAKEIEEKLKENNIKVELDDRNESIGKKVRDAISQKVNFILTIGDKELKNKTLAIRSRDGKVKFGISISKFIKDLLNDINNKC